MDHNPSSVIAGFGCHIDNHAAVLINPIGQVIAKRQFRATAAGCAHALDWARSHGPVLVAGVESTGSYGAGLTRTLTAANVL